MSVYLPAKFEVCSMIRTSFRQGVTLPPTPPQNEPLKSPPRLGLTLKNPFSQRFHFKANRRGTDSSEKRYYCQGFSKLLSVFIWQIVKILNVFNTLALNRFSRKRKSFFKKWSNALQLKVPKLKMPYFHTKLLYQKSMLTQIEQLVQNVDLSQRTESCQ